MATLKPYIRSNAEKAFLILFFPVIIGMYLIYKYPHWFVAESMVKETFYFFGKSLSFWYSTLYTGIVVWICLKVLFKNNSPYKSKKNAPLSSYQRNKFIAILASQLIFFYFLPYFMPFIKNGGDFWNDPYKPLNKDAYVYVYNGFTSLGGAIYIFVIVPLSVWFFGKRYCSWFCACGNLAETIGITKWGSAWVKHFTPRGKMAIKLEHLQVVFLALAMIFGILIFLDTLRIFSAPTLLSAWRAFQDLVVDLTFGALIGVGAYPILGSRIWCRYGCPLAQLMKLVGKFGKSKFKVQATDACKGIGVCTTVCPMGIDVESYAHKDKKPIMGSFGLDETPCIGCGGCVDICPVQALHFEKILKPKMAV